MPVSFLPRTFLHGRNHRLLALALLATFGLAGCGGGGGGGGGSSPKVLNGTVMNGTQPIAGATVLVYSASLTTGAAPQEIGHATSASNGTWSISSFSSTPTSGQLVYAVALGGDAGAGNNPNIALMSAASVDANSHLPASVTLNELTTVATTSQLQNYITEVDCSTITNSSITTTGQNCPSIAGAVGLAARANTIGNLVNLATGADSDFLTSNASTSSAIQTTLQNLNFEANALAACVNTAGGTSGDGSACGNLFALLPTSSDTTKAALSLAQQASNSTIVNGLFALAPTAVYTPAATSAPTSWTVGGSEFAFVTNANDNTVSVYQINASTGAPTAITGSPFTTGSKPLSVTVSPNGAFAYVADLGDDTVSAYSIDPATGTLAPVSGSPFALDSANAQPQSITISPNGAFVYVADFMSGKISAYRTNPSTGALTAVTGSPFSIGSYPTNVTVSPNNLFAYVTNSHDNTVSAYSINASTGELTAVTGSPSATGSDPYAVTVAPNGKFAYVINYTSYTVSTYGIDASSGALTAVGSPVATGNLPQSVVVAPDSRFAYVSNASGGTISVYAIDASTGALTAISGSPFSAGTGTPPIPYSMAISANGAFAYVTTVDNRKLSAFSIDVGTGALTATGLSATTGAGALYVTLSP